MIRVLRSQGRAVVSAMHPAMFLRGSQARFTDPDSGDIVESGSLNHQTADIVNAALHSGFQLCHLGEHAPDEEFAARFPHAEKICRLAYATWTKLPREPDRFTIGYYLAVPRRIFV